MAKGHYPTSTLTNGICLTENCCGCAACSNICPRNCISMEENIYGELQPFIYKAKCIGCDLCKKVCPNNINVQFNEPIACYAGWRKDNNARLKSSSGGLAALMSEYIVAQKGIVFGTLFDREQGAHIEGCNSVEEIEKFKGSKYVQATVGNSYRKVEEKLLSGHKVIFIGMPCQVAGLKAFLANRGNKRLENLWIVDFLCHGSVPNKYLLEELDRIEKKINEKCDDISFRSNDIDKNYWMCLYKRDKIIYRQKAEKQQYFIGFLKSIITRSSCNRCKYKCRERVGDITLGDFIGLGKEQAFHPEEKDWKNPSLILVNSEHGKKLLQYIQENLTLYMREIDEAVTYGPSFHNTGRLSVFRDIFRKLYVKKGWNSAIQKSTMLMMIAELVKIKIQNFKNKCKFKLKTMLGR